MAEQQAASPRIVFTLLLFSVLFLSMSGCQTSPKPPVAPGHGALSTAPRPAKPTFLSQADPLIVNVGNQANDNTGDSVRTAMQKMNSNVVELFTRFGGATNVSPGGPASSIQFNATNRFGGDTNFTFNATTKQLSVAGIQDNGAGTNSLSKLSISGIQIDPRNFGAKGDGVTDDTTALQASINALTNGIPSADWNNLNLLAPSNTPCLVIPSATFRITSPLKVYSFARIRGASRGATIKADFTNGPAIYIGYNNNDPYCLTSSVPWRMSKNITIEDLQIMGVNVRSNAHNAATILNHGIRVDGALRSHFKNLYIHDFGGAGIEDNRSEFCEWDRIHANYCRIGFNKDSTAATGDSTGADNVTDTIRDSRFQINDVGIRIVNSSANDISRCEVEDNVAQIFNMTTEGTYNGTKLESDAYYLPSVGIWLGANAQNNSFSKLYVEDQYVHVYFETNQGGIVGNTFSDCTFNPTDSTAKPDSETCAKHDIYERLNLVNKTSVSDGTNNQAHVVFATTALANAFVGCHFGNNNNGIDHTQKANYKRILFTTDNFTYPLFSRCFGMIFDDNTSIIGGTNPRITLEVFPPTSGDSQAYLSGLAGANVLNGAYGAAAAASFAGLYAKPFAWDSAYVGANNTFQDGWLGDGATQRPVWRTIGHRVGLANNVPTTGTWSKGDVVWNSGAEVYSPAGWQCISAGTPGSWKPFGSYHVTDSSGVISASSPYAPFGVTRTNDFNAWTYIALVRNASWIWGTGIDAGNNWIFGAPDGFGLINNPVMSIDPGNHLNLLKGFQVTGDGFASGFLVATNGFASGGRFGLNQTNTWTATGTNWNQVITGGIITSLTHTP